MGHLAIGIATHTTSPVGQQVAQGLPDLRSALLANTHLCDEMFATVYAGKLTSRDASFLASVASTPAKRAHVFACEKRPTVLQAMLKAQPVPAPGVLDQVLECGLPRPKLAKVISAMVKHWEAYAPTSWAEPFFDDLSGKAPLILAERLDSTLPDAQVAAKLATFTDWAPSKGGQSEAAALLMARPGIAAPLVVSDMHPSLRCAVAMTNTLAGDVPAQRVLAGLDELTAAGGQQSREWVRDRYFSWMAMAANPSTDLSVVQELAEVAFELPTSLMPDEAFEGYGTNPTRNRLKYRAWTSLDYSSEDRPEVLSAIVLYMIGRGKSRPWLVPSIAANPNLSGGDVEAILTALSTDAGLAWGNPRAREALARLTDARRDDIERAGLSEHLKWLAPRPEPEAAPDEVVEYETWWESRPLDTVSNNASAVAVLDQILGDNEAAWLLAYRMADEHIATKLGQFAHLMCDLAS